MNTIGRYNLSVSYENDIRIITVNNSTRIYQFVKKCLDIFDISISTISGIYFYFIDANVYFGDCEENDLNRSFGDLIEEYDSFENRFFIIEPLRLSNREITAVDEFRIKYQFFVNDGSQNYYFRPTITINNNYNTGNDLFTSYLRDRGDNYWNNFFGGNGREQNSQSETTTNNQTSYTSQYFYTNPAQPEQVRPTEQNLRNQNNANGANSSNGSNGANSSNGSNGANGANGASSRRNVFQSPISLISTMLSSMPVADTHTYVSTGVANYTNFLNSLNNLLNQNGQNIMTAEQVNQLRRGSYGNLRNEGHILPMCTTCNITLEEFNDNMQVIALPCGHAFQENAITYWLTHNSNRCPVCRNEVINN